MKKKMKWNKIAVHITLIIGALIVILPFYWMVVTSLKTNAETMLIPATLIPKNWEFSNYIDVMKQFDFGTAYLNTAIVTVVRTVGQLLFCSMAAFAIATLRFPGRNVIFIMMISVLMFPPEMFMIPVYNLMNAFNWLDTYYVLTIPIMASGFGIFLLRQFFMSLPRDLFEAARMDGCSYLRIYWSIYMPLTIPGLVSLGIFVAVTSWNDFLWPLIMTSSQDLQVVSIAVASFVGEHNTNYALMMAGAVISILPLLILYLFLQRYFIEGIALTGVKG